MITKDLPATSSNSGNTRSDEDIVRWEIYKKKMAQENSEPFKKFMRDQDLQVLANNKYRSIDLSGIIEDYIVPLVEPLQKDKELILAITPHYHSYVIAGDREYHGTIYPSRNYTRKNPGYFRALLFIRFLNVSDQHLEMVKKYSDFMRDHKTITCFYGALEVLARGANILPPSKSMLFMKKGLMRILKQSFRNEKGEPISFQIFTTSKKQIKGVLKSIGSLQFRWSIWGGAALLSTKMGRLSKNQSKTFLQENFYLHQDWLDVFPIRNNKALEDRI